jgi:Dolichyl-phosphate-mannose-protein mannosyltransferase
LNSRFLSPAAITISFVAMLIFSWRRWASAIADSGREMDLPLRLLEGDALYRDVFYMYPPFSPYFNSLLYSIWGARLEVLQASGVLFSILALVISYRIARRFLERIDAALAVLAILLLCVFKPSGNLISPYSYSALHGMVFSLATLLFCLRFSENRRFRELFVAGVFAGLAAISKQEFGIVSAITGLATIAWLALLKDRLSHIPHRAKQFTVFVLPILAIVTSVFGWLLYLHGWTLIVEDCHLLLTHLPSSLIYYNSQRTGLDRPYASIVQVFGGAIVCIVIASMITLVSFVCARIHKAEIGRALILKFAVLTIAGGAIFSLIQTTTAGWDGSPLRGLPVILVLVIIVEWKRGKGTSAALMIVAIYSLIVLGRVALRVPSGGAFGSFFLPTSLIILSTLLLRCLRESVEKWSGSRAAGTCAMWAARGLLCAVLIATGAVFAVRYRKSYIFPVSAPRGTLFLPAGVGPAYNETIDFLTSRTRPDDKIAVLPEGSDLTFLSERRNPLRHQNLHPGMMSEEGEAEAIRQLSTQPIAFIVITNRPMREFGGEAFGRDYYQRFGRAIEEEYELVKICGGVSEGEAVIGSRKFFTKIYKRRAP